MKYQSAECRLTEYFQLQLTRSLISDCFKDPANKSKNILLRTCKSQCQILSTWTNQVKQSNHLTELHDVTEFTKLKSPYTFTKFYEVQNETQIVNHWMLWVSWKNCKKWMYFMDSFDVWQKKLQKQREHVGLCFYCRSVWCTTKLLHRTVLSSIIFMKAQ